MADADGATLLGYLMHEWAEHELTLRAIFPPPIAAQVTLEE